MIITINTHGAVTNPRISCASGAQNGWWMQLNTVLADRDEVVISTVRGNKYITINGEDMYNGEPVESLLEFNGTDWLQLEQGENVFNITAESGDTNLHYFIGYKRRFE
jgi:Tfp pilus assembly protein PilX